MRCAPHIHAWPVPSAPSLMSLLVVLGCPTWTMAQRVQALASSPPSSLPRIVWPGTSLLSLGRASWSEWTASTERRGGEQPHLSVETVLAQHKDTEKTPPGRPRQAAVRVIQQAGRQEWRHPRPRNLSTPQTLLLTKSSLQPTLCSTKAAALRVLGRGSLPGSSLAPCEQLDRGYLSKTGDEILPRSLGVPCPQ